jgi:hypothetical protein
MMKARQNKKLKESLHERAFKMALHVKSHDQEKTSIHY